MGAAADAPTALGISTREWVDDRLGGYVRMSIEDRRDAVAELVTEGQRSGEIATAGGDPIVLSPDKVPTTLSDLGITRQRLHEARKLETLSEKDIAVAADDDPRPTDRSDR